MPHLKVELLGAPTPPYTQLRLALTLDVYGHFTQESAEVLTMAVRRAVDCALLSLDLPAQVVQ